jgi:hypothetical protein
MRTMTLNSQPVQIAPHANAAISISLIFLISEPRKSNLKAHFRDEDMQRRERLLLAKKDGG